MDSTQVNAVLRHVGTSAATIATVLATLGVLSADQSAAVIKDVHDMFDGLQQVVGAGGHLIIVLGPVIGVLIAKFAATAASLKGQLTSITTNPQVTIEGTIKVPAPVAAAVPSIKVQAH